MKKYALMLTLALMLSLVAGCTPPVGTTATPTVQPTTPRITQTTQTDQRTAPPAAGGVVDLMKGLKPAGQLPAITAPDDKTILAELNFAVNLLKQTAEAEPNVILSPLSADLALGMALNGARGTTQSEMLTALAAAGQSPAEFNQGRRNVIALMQPSNGESKLRIANAIWTDDRLDVAPQFLQTNADYYAAAARQMRLSTTQAKDAINQWAAESTENRIKEVIAEPLPDDARMVLANAVYFLADWKVPFAKELTQTEAFASPSGKRDVQMMNGKIQGAYLSGQDYTGVVMPYKDPRFAFFVLLPNSGQTPDQLLNNLDGAKLRQALADREAEPIVVSLPKLELRANFDLIPPLQNLGMRAAFSPQMADFGAMNASGEKDLVLDGVNQSTYLRVDEKGTEAAAVTVIVAGTTAAGPEPKRLKVDRPFLCGIIETSTRIPLFFGIVREPNQAS